MAGHIEYIWNNLETYVLDCTIHSDFALLVRFHHKMVCSYSLLQFEKIVSSIHASAHMYIYI